MLYAGPACSQVCVYTAGVSCSGLCRIAI